MLPDSFIEVYADGMCWYVLGSDEVKLRQPRDYTSISGWLVLSDIDGVDLNIRADSITVWSWSTPESRANARALQAQLDAEHEEPRLPWEH